MRITAKQRFLVVAVLSFVLILIWLQVQQYNKPATTVSEILAKSLNSSSEYAIENPDRLTFYQIKLNIAESLRNFKAEQTVNYTNTGISPLNEVFFQLPPNLLPQVETGKDNLQVAAVEVAGISAPFLQQKAGLFVTLPQRLLPNESVEISLRFDGRVPVCKGSRSVLAEGFVQLINMLRGDSAAESEGYGTYALCNGMLSLDHWYPIIPHAVNKMPERFMGDIAAYDVAAYRVEIDAPIHLTVVTSGFTDSEPKINDQRKIVWQVGAGLRDFAVVAGNNFTVRSKKVDGVEVNSYYLASHCDGGKKVLDYASEALRYYSNAFGPYPFKEFDVVEGPVAGGAGGMEYSGLVTISSQMYEPFDLSSIPFLAQFESRLKTKEGAELFDDMLEFVVAHEVAHQWWAGLVGSDSQQQPFVDESLTNYSSVLYFEDRYGLNEAKKQRYLQLTMPYQIYRLSGGTDLAVNLAMDDVDDAMQYSAIVYGKGALYYDALRSRMGDRTFFAILRKYAKDNSFSFVTDEALKQAAIETLKSSDTQFKSADFEHLQNRWLNGQYADSDIGRFAFGELVRIVVGKKMLVGQEGQQLEQFLQAFDPLINAITVVPTSL